MVRARPGRRARAAAPCRARRLAHALCTSRAPTCPTLPAGPTGCGKTSLINALAGRLPIGGTLEGQILVNGLPRGKGFRAVSAYVMQVLPRQTASSSWLYMTVRVCGQDCTGHAGCMAQSKVGRQASPSDVVMPGNLVRSPVPVLLRPAGRRALPQPDGSRDA